MGLTVQYSIIRSDRKSIAVQVQHDGNVIVRAPKRMRIEDIRRFVESKAGWIEKHLPNRTAQNQKKLTEQELKALREKARALVTERVQHYAPIIGVNYNQIVIRAQHTRWGSCSSKGNLNFNCLLALVPTEVLDYIVVHELCHLKELNHSDCFWDEVGKILPDYKTRKKWLKDNGSNLIARL